MVKVCYCVFRKVSCNVRRSVSHLIITSFLILPLLLSTASPDSISLQQALHESVFSPGMSASTPHRVALCWDKHCQLLPEVLGLSAKRVAAWNSEEVRGPAAVQQERSFEHVSLCHLAYTSADRCLLVGFGVD